MENSFDNVTFKSCDNNDNDKTIAVHPIVLKPSETSLVVDGEDSDELQEVLRQNNNSCVNPPPSAINIESSSDVVIGPLTQFHGPVTIYQNVNSDNQVSYENVNGDVAYKKPAKSTTDTTNNSPEKYNPTTVKPSTSYKRLAVYISIAMVMLTSVIVTVAVTLNITTNNELGNSDDNSVIFRNDTNETHHLGKHRIFTRSEWGGRPSLNFTKPLQHPTEYVLISHTAGHTCKNLPECSVIMRQIQSEHVSTWKSPDIGYNFLIGGDANIYVGRGWDIRNFHRDHNIGISFMGNYVYDELTPGMISALKELLKQGVDLKKLSPDYKLVCHNQTYATLSPGKNIYEVISKFPHFYPDFVIID